MQTPTRAAVHGGDRMSEDSHPTTVDAQAGQHLVAQYAVSHALAQSGDLSDSAPRILQAIGEGLGWDYAALWIVDEREDILRCIDTWHRRAAASPRFDSLSRRNTFGPGVGLPGRVWSSRQPAWIVDVGKDINFPRMMTAASEGLRAASAFPILLGGKVLGVFEFLSHDVREPDRAIINTMASLGAQIGQFLERKRVEQAVRESEARKSAILASALDAIISMDSQGRVIEFNPAAEKTFGYTREEALGREMAELIIPPSLREHHRRGLARYLATGEGPAIGKRLELTGMRSDGSELPVELAITRVPWEGPPLFTGYVRDITERKRTEEALSASEVRFRTVIEQSPLSIQIFAPDGRTLRVNRAWEELWGVTLDRLPGYNVLQDPQLLEKGIMPYIEQGFAGQPAEIPPVQYVPEETVSNVTDVTYRWVRAFIYPVKDESGNVQEVVLVHEDVTEQIRAQEDLRRSEASLAAAQEIAHLGSWEWDLATDEVRWSDETYRIYGYCPGEFTATADTFWKLVHPQDVEYVRQSLHGALYEGKPYDLEHRVLRPDGETRIVHRQGETVLDGEGKPVRMRGIVHDITERKKAEEELRQSEGRYRSLVLASSQIVWTTDVDGKVVTDQPGWRTFTGQSVEQTQGWGWVNAVHPEDRWQAARGWVQAARRKRVYDTEYRLRRHDGVYRHFAVRAVPVLAADSDIREWIGTCTDITERKQAEAEREVALSEAQHALQLRNRFLAMASHELKTPVTLLKGYAQVLSKQAQRKADADLVRPLRVISRQVERINDLVDNLLNVSRIESGRIEFVIVPFNLNAAVEEVVGEMRDSLANFSFRLDQPAQNVWVRGDRTRLQQVVTNLLTNAVKYSHERKEVDVVLRQEGDRAQVYVTDYGIGIPDEQQGQVFDLYFRATNAPASNYAGLGLGLYISKAIIERHQGTIGVRSKEGEGSTFYFCLPILDADPQEQEPEGRRGPGGLRREV